MYGESGRNDDRRIAICHRQTGADGHGTARDDGCAVDGVG